MKKRILAVSLLAIFIFPVHALDVGDISSFLNSDSNVLNKEIRNPTDNGRLVNISIERISSPLEDGKIIQMEVPGEVLMTPASLLLPAKANENIRFFYKGLEDDKERYYRIVWFDQALSDVQQGNTTRSAMATASARIGTILVVAPRKVKYNHIYDNGKISNTGNATLRVLAYGPCVKPTEGKECKENYFLLPNRDRKFSRVDINNKNSRVALWQGDYFVSVK